MFSQSADFCCIQRQVENEATTMQRNQSAHTAWVQVETLRHLHDELSYRKVTQQDWCANHLCVINARERLVSIYSRLISSYVARFLRSFDHCVNSAKFYIIPKVHKDSMMGRPIAASHSYITRLISVFVDELI